MSDLKSKFLNRMFRHIGGLVWDLTTGKIGYRTQDGILTFSVEETPGPNDTIIKTPTVNANPFDTFSVDIPAFAANTPLEQIDVGDVLVGANAVLGWVTETTGASLKYLSFDGHSKTYTPQKVAILGVGGGTLIVKSLTSLLGGDAGRQGLESQLLPLILLNGKDGLEDTLPLLLMSTMGGVGGGNIGQMLMMKSLFGGQTGQGGDMMEKFMMMQMLGGNTGGLFGSAPAAGGSAAPAMNPLMLMALMGGKENGGGLGGLLGGSSKPTLSAPALAGKPPLTPISR